MAKVYCPQCEAMAINGMACHETGCPNEDQRWKFKSIGRDPNNRSKHLKICIPANEEVPTWMKE